MKKRICFLLALLTLIGALGLQWTVADAIIPGEDAVTTEEKIYCNATLEDNFADDRVLVVLNNAASTSLKTYALTDFTGYGFKSVTNLTSATTALANAKLQGQPIPEEFATNSNVLTFEDFYDVNLETFNQILCLELKTPGKQNVLNAIKVLEKHPNVKYAGPDYAMSIFTAGAADPYIGDQDVLDMIQLPEAWEIASDNMVLVGILDTGVDTTHPDLADVMYSGIDSYDCTGTNIVIDNSNDTEGHGTMVAGIIAATHDNGIGIAGICPSARLISFKVFEGDTGTVSSAIKAIERAQLLGVSLLNLSGGYSVSRASQDYSDLYEAIENYGGLLVCAAGNDGVDCDSTTVIPAVYQLDNMITVGACTQIDSIRSDSNYGFLTVDLFAPGENILTCYSTQRCDSSCSSDGHYSYGYHHFNRTSAAAPFVTGVAALIMAKYPTHSVTQIIERIRLGMDRVYNGTADVYADYCAWGGRLNAYKALHDHGYTVADAYASQHKLICECGVIKYAEHDWEDVTITLPTGATVIGEQCATCGYQQS